MGKHRRGEGSVYYDHANRSWVARVSLGVVNGKRQGKKVSTGQNEALAHSELARMLRAYGAGGDPASETLDRYLAQWLEDHRPTVRPSTFVSYQGHVDRHIRPLLGGIPLARLRPSDVRRLIADRLAAGLAPATVGLIVTTLRIALGQAHADRAIPDNPAAAVKLPRVERAPIEAMTEEMADAIIAATKGTFLEALVVLLLGSGVRLGEALGLDWGDVHEDEGYVTIRRSKTKVRVQVISEDAAEALRSHRARRPRIGKGEPVFLGPRTHDRLTTMTVSHAFPKMLVAAGLPRLTPHGLRHGVATRLMAKGVHRNVIADYLGHATPAMTDRYMHVAPRQLVEAAEMLNRNKGG